MNKIINKSIDKLKIKPTNGFTANYNYDDDDDDKDTISVLDKTDYDYDNVFQKFINKIINLIPMKIY